MHCGKRSFLPYRQIQQQLVTSEGMSVRMSICQDSKSGSIVHQKTSAIYFAPVLFFTPIPFFSYSFPTNGSAPCVLFPALSDGILPLPSQQILLQFRLLPYYLFHFTESCNYSDFFIVRLMSVFTTLYIHVLAVVATQENRLSHSS